MNITEDLSLMDKLTILSDAAKYDVACTSSGIDRKGNREGDGKYLRPRNLPHLFRRRQVCIFAQDTLYKRMHLPLRLLSEQL